MFTEAKGYGYGYLYVYVNVITWYSSAPSVLLCDIRRMQKQTYSISELASEFEVTTRTIRFYEEKGLVQPMREGQKRLYTAADRVRIKLILRGKRIGMTLQESVEVIDLYDPQRNNAEQLLSLINTISVRRARLLQQKDDIDDMLIGLNEVLRLCEKALGKSQKKTSAAQNN